jgi:hypothetical protein
LAEDLELETVVAEFELDAVATVMEAVAAV